MSTKIIKCPNCGVFNTNRDYCKNCNYLLSEDIKKNEKVNKIKQDEIEKVIYEKENPGLAERLKKHPFVLYKIIGWILYSIIMVISLIGAGLAWFIAMVAAG